MQSDVEGLLSDGPEEEEAVPQKTLDKGLAFRDKVVYYKYCRKALEQGCAYEPCQVRKEAALSMMQLVL